MARRACAAVPATALLLLALVAGASAITCAPGEGVAQTNVLSFLGALFGGKAPTEQPARCSPCGRNEASRGGEGAVCEMCAPTLAAPNTDHTACECLPGTYTATAASDTTVQRTCIACGHHAVSNRRNAGSCTACPENAKATADHKCGCEPGYVATGVNEFGVTGCRKCAVGQVSPGGLSIQCVDCSEATPALPDNSACGCRAGQRVDSLEPLSCVKCDSVLTYTAQPNRAFTCAQCAPFSYATADNTNCVCGGGYYASKVSEDGNALKCVACPEGTHKPSAGNTDASGCTACPAGTEASGSRRQCVPARCPAGTQRVASADGQSSTCQLCGETEYNYRRGGSCRACTDNTLPNPQRTKCDACANGYLQTSQSGQDLACNACMVTFKWDEATKTCQPDAEDQAVEHVYKPGAAPKKPTKIRGVEFKG